MQIRARLSPEQAHLISLLDHGLLALSLALEAPIPPPANRTDKEYRIELSGADARRFELLSAHWGLSRAALVRAALQAAADSHLRPAHILRRNTVLAAIRKGAHIRRTTEARTHNQAAEVFDAAGASLGFLSVGTLRSLRSVKSHGTAA